MNNRDQSLSYWKPYVHTTFVVFKAQSKPHALNAKISNAKYLNQKKGSFSDNEDPVSPENDTEHAETRDESAIEHVKKPNDQGNIIRITEDDGESPRKKRLWDSKEEKEMVFKKICFEAIPEETQNNWEVPDEMAKYSKKYFAKYVRHKELEDSITLNSPVSSNLPKSKTMGDYFVELLEDQKKKKEIALGNTFKKLQTKILTIMGPLSKGGTEWKSHQRGVPRDLMLTRCRNILIKLCC